MLSFPYIALQMWRFVAPGLYKSEKGAFLPFLVASPFMFILGASFAFYVVTPLAYDFFLGFQQFGAEGEAVADGAAPLSVVFQGSAQEYLNLTIKFIVAFGLCFQLPVLLTLMGKAGLVSAEGLGSVRKYAVVAILVLAALVTPPDVITQVILFVVVYGLYEVSILLVRRVEAKREAQVARRGLLRRRGGLRRRGRRGSAGGRAAAGRGQVSRPALDRIAQALERLSPAPLPAPDFAAATGLRLACGT